MSVDNGDKGPEKLLDTTPELLDLLRKVSALSLGGVETEIVVKLIETIAEERKKKQALQASVLRQKAISRVKGQARDTLVLDDLYKATVERLKDHRTVSGHLNTRFGFLIASIGAFLGFASRGHISMLVYHHPHEAWVMAFGLTLLIGGFGTALFGIAVQGPRTFDPLQLLKDPVSKADGFLTDKDVYREAALAFMEDQRAENETRINRKVRILRICIGLLIVGGLFVTGGGVKIYLQLDSAAKERMKHATPLGTTAPKGPGKPSGQGPVSPAATESGGSRDSGPERGGPATGSYSTEFQRGSQPGG